MFFLPAFIGIPLFFFVGSVFGSFGNVVVERLPLGISLNGRSHCVGCKKNLRVWELVPVVSWCFLRGKCARCKAVIPGVFTIVELISGFLFAMALHYAAFNVFVAIPVAIALWAMLCIALIDIRTRTIPDLLTLMVVACGIALRVYDQVVPLVPIIIGGGFFGAQWIVSRGAWVGSGDIFLGTALGMLLGTWPLTVLMLWLAYVLGLLFVLVRLPFQKLNLNAHIAFGPFIVLGAALSLLYGNWILGLVLPSLFR